MKTEFIELDGEVYEVEKTSLILPENIRFINRLRKFNPRLINNKDWYLNGIITENPVTVITKVIGSQELKIQYKDKVYIRRNIDAVYYTLNGIKNLERKAL
jgi:hypothetical protein